MECYRFGKHAPKSDYRTLRFKDYLTPELPAPPPSLSLLTRVYEQLGISDPKTLFPMDANDRLGDCTIAALAHAVTTYSGLIGKKHIMASSAVVKLYRHLTGGPDSGLAALDVLNYWRAHSAGGDEILAYVKVDARDHVHVQQAIELFGGVYLGFQVQEGCIEDFQANQPWTPGPLTQDGHAVFAVAYDRQGVTVLTWGSTQRGTWAWWNECVDEAYAILPPEARNPAFAPGFKLAQLRRDLEEVAS